MANSTVFCHPAPDDRFWLSLLTRQSGVRFVALEMAGDLSIFASETQLRELLITLQEQLLTVHEWLAGTPDALELAAAKGGRDGEIR